MIDKISFELSVVAYYLSKYNEKALDKLGYKTQIEAFKRVSFLLGRENNYLKLRRDEFDVLTGSSRKGFRNRPVTKNVQELYDVLCVLSFDEITLKVNTIIREAKERFDKETEDILDDSAFMDSVNKTVKFYSGKKTYKHEPQAVKNTSASSTSNYKRDPVTAANALCNADYKCEICSEHDTFIRRCNDLPYTEPHHLVPLKEQKNYSVSLDVENNVISLCSNCHNRLHYGKDVDKMLQYLYDKRKGLLKEVGINISFEKLLECYGK